MRLSIVGSWHQALVLCGCFAEMGHEVIGIVGAPAAAADLSSGRLPVDEPGLAPLLEQNRKLGRLRFAGWSREALAGSDFVFLSIDTPVGQDDESDLRPIFEAAEQIASNASGSFILCVTAQVPIGTCSAIQEMIRSKRPDLAIPVAYVPEFLRLGTALQSFREADRFVIGADDPEVARRVATLYEPLHRPVYHTRVASAEMAKHASNAFLATSISFINQIADLCEKTGADVTEVSQILKLDRRIGAHAFLDAGLGYAGGTLGREIQALRRLGDRHRVSTDLLAAVEEVNLARLGRVISRLRDFLPKLAGVKIAIWGLAYKPGTSTLRRSAALRLIELLHQEGAVVSAYDPLARPAEMPASPPFDLCREPGEALKGASALVLTGRWPELDQVDFAAVSATMKRRAIVDTGNFLSPLKMAEAGFEYFGVGR